MLNELLISMLRKKYWPSLAIYVPDTVCLLDYSRPVQVRVIYNGPQTLLVGCEDVK